MDTIIVAKRLEISGVVQGVGFRPFLFVLADKYRLNGEVSNTSSGVLTIIEGSLESIEFLIDDIYNKSPLLASVNHIESSETEVKNFTSFQIVKSKASSSKTTLISPDVTICDDCLVEMKDPSNRRFEYPFINCTNCGPRYTIIEDVPYDRPKTSMKQFRQCTECQAEYDNPLDRRFHAQPNACPECGPQVFITDNKGNQLTSNPDEAISFAAKYLSQGKIVAVKGLGGFHLACDASNDIAVQALRERKTRPHKPFALMGLSASVLFDHLHVSAEEKVLLNSYHRPIVLLNKKGVLLNNKGNTKIDHKLSGLIAPFNNSFGVMLPYTPLHYLLLDKGPDILVMTSGNRSGEPLSIDNDDALDAFSHIADYFLFHDRDIFFRADDSIARIQAGEQRFLRRSRGYAPLPIYLKRDMPKILAAGAGLKSTVCLTKNNLAFLSQHIGDLDNVKVFNYYQDSINHLKQILDIEPEIIAYDIHPGLMSSEYATQYENKGNSINKIAVQHHHAHAVSCMAEHDLSDDVIAITLDGTGYGTDGNIWGGEILLCNPNDFIRKAHLSYIKMPGGDAAVLEPWRMATSILYQVFGIELLNLEIPLIKEVPMEKLSFVCQMLEKNLNSPLTSSAGRVFDAISSLLGVRHEVSYESQAAIELEAIVKGMENKEYYGFKLHPYETDNGNTVNEIDLKPCIQQIINSIQYGESKALISLKFHNTIVDAFSIAAAAISRETGVKKIVLSGGVFNNDIILDTMIQALEEKNLKVYTHSKVPCGDGGICLGQAVIAAAIQGK